MAQEITAEALLARVAEYDEAALGELYDRYAACLLGMVLRAVPDRDAAEEVVEGVFSRLWHEAKRCSGVGVSVSAWLRMAALDAAFNRRHSDHKHGRKARRTPEVLQKRLDWLPAPEEAARLEARRDLLRKVVNELPKPQRGALELAAFEGYSEPEIAEKLGEPLARVRSSLRAGMRFLRHRLRAVMGTWTADI